MFWLVSMVTAVVADAPVFNNKEPVVSDVATSPVVLVVPALIELITAP